MKVSTLLIEVEHDDKKDPLDEIISFIDKAQRNKTIGNCITTKDIPKVHCSFVNAYVDQKDLNEHCDGMIKDYKCTACELSPQIGYGVPPERIIENFTRGNK